MGSRPSSMDEARLVARSRLGQRGVASSTDRAQALRQLGGGADVRIQRAELDMSEKTTVPAIEGWFVTGANPHLLGSRCKRCKTYFFPKETTFCRNPTCDSAEFEEVPLSRTGKLWSFTNNCYAPPAPYVSPDPFVPTSSPPSNWLKRRWWVVWISSRRCRDQGLARRHADGARLDPLFEDDDNEYVVWKWRAGDDRRGSMSRRSRHRRARRRHAPVGQVGAQLRRVRRSRRRTRWPTRMSRGPTSSSSRAATRCATAIRATSPGDVRASARLDARRSRRLTRLRVGRPRYRLRGPRSSPAYATSRSSSVPTRRRKEQYGRRRSRTDHHVFRYQRRMG